MRLSPQNIVGRAAAGVRSGIGNWPILTAALLTTGAFALTAGVLEARWPEPPEAAASPQRKPNPGALTAQAGDTSGGGGLPQNISLGGADNGPASGGGGAGGGSGSGGGGNSTRTGKSRGDASAAASEPESSRRNDEKSEGRPAAPRAIQARDYQNAVRSGEIRVPTVAEFERAANVRVVGTPEQRAAMEANLTQNYIDAAHAGGVGVNWNGVRGVVVGENFAQRFGVTAASPVALRNIASNRSMAAGRQFGGQQRGNYQRGGGGGYMHAGFHGGGGRR